jgi:hypothetical protein
MAATKWHYYVRRGELSQDALNDIGKEGWELVSVGSDQDEPVFYFKRAYPSLAESITLEQRERYFDEWGVGPDQGPS